MRRLVLLSAALLLLSALLCAQLHGGKKSEDLSAPRHLIGIVLDTAHHAASGAVVYLKNKRTLAISTYIAGDDGAYRFNNLSPDIDYEVHAEFNGRKSAIKTLSSFDTHKQARINLKLKK